MSISRCAIQNPPHKWRPNNTQANNDKVSMRRKREWRWVRVGKTKISEWGLGVRTLESAGCALGGFGRCGSC
ncbi:uncharacterized protein BJ212DRAFT_1363185 [Suillus subaureus]|uniref:Uncharacterized protein n=1 Tax=Suillus subaureus TaxID=48587 RepID=A0A9P7E929_9AGAM|nr:uncharacterized protein BJ212DRAFT_1363185 [Suillus subaureus]KAG1814346.1 hypothetical protein BJ212DRAFT_1363185 [Suillus subaureus]